MDTPLRRRRTARTTKLLLGLFSVMSAWSCGSAEEPHPYTKAVGAADEGSTIQTLRTISSAQGQYRASTGAYGSFSALNKAGMLDMRFAADAPTLKGYRFTMDVSSPQAFTVNADPEATESQPAIGSRHFFLDPNGVIRVNGQQPAGPGDPPLQ